MENNGGRLPAQLIFKIKSHKKYNITGLKVFLKYSIYDKVVFQIWQKVFTIHTVGRG